MKTNEQKFDEYCRDHGLGELATSQNTHPSTFIACNGFDLFFRTRRDNFEKYLKQQYRKSIQIQFGFCANPSVNAFAARHSKGLYLIGINTGTIVELSRVYEQLFTQAPLLGKDLRLGAAQRSLGRSQIFIGVAFQAAFDYIFGHELGHIAYGHADLVHNNSRGETYPLLFEANLTRGLDKLSSDLFQSMEVDADLYAATSLISSLSRGVLCGLRMTDFLSSKTDLLKVSMIAILTMFHLFYGKDVSLAEYKSKSHPLPEIRLLKFWMRAWQIQERIPGISFKVNIMDQLMSEIFAMVPQSLRDSTFPCWRLEGSVNISNEAARIRANEDLYARQLNSFAMIPVGAVIS